MPASNLPTVMGTPLLCPTMTLGTEMTMTIPLSIRTPDPDPDSDNDDNDDDDDLDGSIAGVDADSDNDSNNTADNDDDNVDDGSIPGVDDADADDESVPEANHAANEPIPGVGYNSGLAHDANAAEEAHAADEADQEPDDAVEDNQHGHFAGHGDNPANSAVEQELKKLAIDGAPPTIMPGRTRQQTRVEGYVHVNDGDVDDLISILMQQREPGVQHPNDYSHNLPELESVVMTQVNVKKGLKLFKERGVQAVSNEIKQMHDRNVMKPKAAATLTKEEKEAALEYL